jgi:hypothetical protein
MKAIVRNVSASLLSFAALLSLVMLLLATVDLGSGPAPGAAEEWRNVTVVYTSDVKGKIDPCG